MTRYGGKMCHMSEIVCAVTDCDRKATNRIHIAQLTPVLCREHTIEWSDAVTKAEAAVGRLTTRLPDGFSADLWIDERFFLPAEARMQRPGD